MKKKHGKSILILKFKVIDLIEITCLGKNILNCSVNL